MAGMVQADFKFSSDEFTKRIMFGNAGAELPMRMQHAGEQVVEFAKQHIRSSLFPGHGYITGTLWRSYHGEVSTEAHGAKVRVGSELYYAPFVEYGTWKMVARIHFRIGIIETEEEIPRILEEQINQFIRG